MSGPQSTAGMRFAVLALLAGLTAACDGLQPDLETLASCPAGTVPIHRIQGNDYRSPMEGRSVTVTGVVTATVPKGLYIESLDRDNDDSTSEGLFLNTTEAMSLAPGTVVSATGVVAELGERRDTQTALQPVESLQPCGPPAARPEQEFDLPLTSRDRESLENMRVRFSGELIVSDVYRLHQGDFRASTDYLLPIPTEVERPGSSAMRLGQANRERQLYLRLPAESQASFPLGTGILSPLGVLGHDGVGGRLLLESAPTLRRPAIPELEPPGDEIVRVVSFNLRNYFNGDGEGGGFPAPRGPKSRSAFEDQRERMRGAITFLNPHILAVQELENDGFNQTSAAADLMRDLEEATGAPWKAVIPALSPIGTDQITVGLFYRPDIVAASGPAHWLDAAPFDLLNRTPLAQVFQPIGGGGKFLVNVNHFKSKGSCPEQGRDRDQNDGQGCWNPARTAAAGALAQWLKRLATSDANGEALILGDLNAYRMEDPVQKLLTEGFLDLTATVGHRHEYTYGFGGQTGTLDHALATPALRARVAQARNLHINADYVHLPSNNPNWLGSSDHDPVVVDLVISD